MDSKGKKNSIHRRVQNAIKHCLLLGLVVTSYASAAEVSTQSQQTFDVAARDTLTVARMNHGDLLRFQLRNGETRTFVLKETTARIVERLPAGILYSFECRLIADGQPLTLRRFVCSQESFYEPWVVNGVRIWFSSSAAIFKLVPIRYPDQHDKFDEVDVILALQDATLPICPQPMKRWYPHAQRFIDVGRCYHGDDPWLGPFMAKACHVGLDINMPKGTPLYAPIDFDVQLIYSDNHRWRGIRRWPNGDMWALQSHHVDRLLIEEEFPVKQGTHYAEAAGKAVGSHPHSHFEFRIGPDVLNRQQLGGTELDPWILFWQIFETERDEQGAILANMSSLSPAATGRPVQFSAVGSRSSQNGSEELQYFWSFGDGGWSNDQSPVYTFARPGVYPVTLVVHDGRHWARHTQHITVNGESLPSPALVLHSPDEVTFRRRPQAAADVYGWPVQHVPHTLRFAALPNGPIPTVKEVLLENAGGGTLPQAEPPQVNYLGDQRNWIQVVLESDASHRQKLSLSVNPHNLPAGQYKASVSVHCPGAMNALQAFMVELNVRPTPDVDELVVDDRDNGFDATPCFWVGHQFYRTPDERKGFGNRYLTNGGVRDADAFARFTPDLAAGRYQVLFHPQTPFVEADFPVRIRHAAGEETIRFTPSPSTEHSLGIFEFAEGTDGFVEIRANDSKGLVVVDAVMFRRLNEE